MLKVIEGGAISPRVAALQNIEQAIMNNQTSTTYELICPQIQFMELSDKAFEEMGLDLGTAYSIVSNAISGNDKVIIGPYQIHAYVDMFKQLEQLKKSINRENCESRQFIIRFGRLHCFQTIQILIRDNEVFAVANMRSCCFDTHLLTDAFMTYMCGVYVADEIFDKGVTGGESLKVNVIMNIGSLHIFKDEV